LEQERQLFTCKDWQAFVILHGRNKSVARAAALALQTVFAFDDTLTYANAVGKANAAKGT